MKHFSINRLTLGLAAGLLAATPAMALEKVTFAASNVTMLNLPLYAADMGGMFAKNGIELENRKFTGGATALAATLSGGSDFYIGSTASAVRAAEKGAGALIVATLTDAYPINIIVRKSAVPGITEATPLPARLAAIKGLRIGVSGAGSGTHQIVQYMLDQQGLDPRSGATIAFVGGGQSMLAAFQSGNVDAVAAANPDSDTVVADMNGLELINGTGGEYPGLEGFPFMSVITSRSLAESKPDLVRRVVASLSEGAKLMHDKGPAGLALRDKVYAKYFSSTRKDIFDAAWKNSVATFPEHMTPDAAKIKMAIAFLSKFSEQPVTVAPEKTFSTEYAPTR